MGAWKGSGILSPASACRGIALPRDRRLEPGEEERILAGCEAAGQPLLRPIVVWALETAMRQGEILALEARSIRGNIAYLHDMKNTRARSVPLSSRALRVLDGLPVPLRGPLFPITQSALEHYWRKALRIAGIEGLRFHDLRHEATSRLFERGLHPIKVLSFIGWHTQGWQAQGSSSSLRPRRGVDEGVPVSFFTSHLMKRRSK